MNLDSFVPLLTYPDRTPAIIDVLGHSDDALHYV